jgi:hypothetical protein
MAGLKSIKARRDETLAAAASSATEINDEDDDTNTSVQDTKRTRNPVLPESLQTVLTNYSNGKVTESILTQQLNTAVERADLEAALEGVEAQEVGISSGGAKKAGGGPSSSGQTTNTSVFIAPTSQSSYINVRDLFTNACGLRLFKSAFAAVGSEI